MGYIWGSQDCLRPRRNVCDKAWNATGGPFLMGNWQSSPHHILTLWKEGRKPPPGGLHTKEETVRKTKSQSPSCEHFFFLMQKLAWSHLSRAERAKCQDSIKSGGGVPGILTWPGCWEGSHSHYREPDSSRAWKERPVRATAPKTPGVGPNQKYANLISMARASPVAQWSRTRCQYRKRGLNPWVRKIPWKRQRPPTPVFLPGKSHGQRSALGYRVRHDWATEHACTISMALSTRY